MKGTFSGTALNHVVYGMSTMGLKWKDLGEMQNPLLEALGLACATIRKQDLDFVMGKLGQMGSSTFAKRSTPRDLLHG